MLLLHPSHHARRLTGDGLGEDGKEEPRPDLVRVVGARNEVEQQREWVAGRDGDLALRRACAVLLLLKSQ